MTGTRGAEWRLERRDGLLLALCEPLEGVRGIVHAFSTRRADGGQDFDPGGAGPASESVMERRLRLLEAAGLPREVPLVLSQVHGARVVLAAVARQGERADGAVWTFLQRSEAVPSVRTADCVPILLADRRGRGAAAVHAGWRGTAAGIAGAAVGAFAEQGIEPADLVAALGPAILRCCYEVDPEVAERVARACGGRAEVARPAGGDGRLRLDLHAANRSQLLAAGIPAASIHAAPWCTCCRGDLFFSFRRDGEGCGRLMAVIGGTCGR